MYICIYIILFFIQQQTSCLIIKLEIEKKANKNYLIYIYIYIYDTTNKIH